MLDQLLNIDIEIFEWINSGWSNPIADFIAPIIRNKNTWIPLYIFTILFFPIKFKKAGIRFIVFLLITLVLSDQISASFFKPFFDRLRPCRNTDLFETINILVHCGHSKSFVSSHAANHFALASFVFYSIKNLVPKIGWFVFIWAGLISIAQVYVGVHFPSDIIIGGIIGFLIGYSVHKIYKKYFSLIEL